MNHRSKRTRSPHTRRTRGICAALVFIFLFCGVLSFPITATRYVGEGNTAKISAELLACMETSADPDEMFPILVWLNAIPASDINAEMPSQYDMGLQSFEDEEIYYTRTRPAFEAELAKKFSAAEIHQPISTLLASNDSAQSLFSVRANDTAEMAQAIKTIDPVFEYMSDKTLQKGIELNKSLLDLYANTQIEAFKSVRNAVVSRLIAEQNALFFSSLSNFDYEVIYQSRYVAFLMMTATEETIRYMSTRDVVFEINPGHEVESEYSEDETQTEFLPDYAVENEVVDFSYTGFGVTVGVLEATGYDEHGERCEGIYSSASQLQNADVTWLGPIQYNDTSVLASKPSEHSTYVASVIAGQRYKMNEEMVDEYEGIAFNSTVVGFTMRLFSNDICDELTYRQLLEGLEILLDHDADIINVSMGITKYHQYSYIDQFVDAFVNQNNVLVVVATGNYTSKHKTHEITSPAHAYNAIAVGNVDPSNGSVHTIAEKSCYDQSKIDWASNKPDICAVGEVRFPIINETLGHSENGTSFAAPKVAATLALMLEANEALKTTPTVNAKSLLLASADFNGVSGFRENDPITCNLNEYNGTAKMRIKSGVGLLNIENACTLAASSAYCTTSLSLKDEYDIANEPERIATFSRRALKDVAVGQKIRVVMCFAKPESCLLQNQYWNDFNLALSVSGKDVAWSRFQNNNVEVIEFTVTEAVQHKMHVDLANYRLMDYWSQGLDIVHIAVAYRIIG